MADATEDRDRLAAFGAAILLRWDRDGICPPMGTYKGDVRECAEAAGLVVERRGREVIPRSVRAAAKSLTRGREIVPATDARDGAG